MISKEIYDLIQKTEISQGKYNKEESFLANNPHYYSDKKVMSYFLKNFPYLFPNCSQELRDDLLLLSLTFASTSTNYLEYCSDKFKNNETNMLLLAGMQSKTIHYLGDELKNKKDFITKIVFNDGDTLKHVIDKFKNDKDVVLAAVSSKGEAFEFASEELKNDREFVYSLLQLRPNIYKHISDRLKEDEELARLAIAKDINSLNHAGNSIKGNFDILAENVIDNPSVVKCIPVLSPLFADEEKILELFKLNPKCVMHILPTVWNKYTTDLDFVFNLYKTYKIDSQKYDYQDWEPKLLKFMSEELKQQINGTGNNIGIIEYFENMIAVEKMNDKLNEKIPSKEVKIVKKKI